MIRTDEWGHRLRAEQGELPISAILVLAAVAAMLFAVFGAANGDPDRYGRAPVPSVSRLSLPSAETDIAYVHAAPAGGQAAPPPADLRILVRDLETGELLQVNSNGGDQSTEGDEILRPVARVDPPGAGVYEIRVTGTTGAALAPQIAFGESPIGAVGDRFSKLGELISGPYGILAGALLLAAMLAPSVRRALQSAKRE